MTYLLIQQIQSTWTAKSRGMPAANKRNAVPERLRFPNVDYPYHNQYYVNENHFDEWAQFQRRTRDWQAAIGSEMSIHCLTLNIVEGNLNLDYCHRVGLAGLPHRDHTQITKRLFALPPGEWGQIIYNGRTQAQDEGFWIYHKWVFNIAFVDQVKPNLFLVDSPSHQYSDMADLF